MVKFQEYENESNEFTFPNNPQVFTDELQPNNELTPIPYSNFHVFVGNDTLKPIVVSATGNLVLNNKYIDFETLSNFICDSSKIIKFFFKDDRFYYCLGSQIKKTNASTRTNFIDYVFSGVAMIPLSFGSTLHESSYNGLTWTNGTQTNEGGTYTYIEEVAITLNDSASAGDTITFNSTNVSGITYTLNDNYLSGEVLTIKILRYEYSGNSNIKITEFWKMYDESNNNQSKAISSGKRELALRLDSGARIDTYTISTSGISYSNITFKFRDGYRGA